MLDDAYDNQERGIEMHLQLQGDKPHLRGCALQPDHRIAQQRLATRLGGEIAGNEIKGTSFELRFRAWSDA